MTPTLTNLITSADPALRDQALERAIAGLSTSQLLAECDALDAFRRTSTNLYDRVRAIFFLYAIHRFHLPLKQGVNPKGLVPFEGYEDILQRRFPEAIAKFLGSMESQGVNDAISSALATAYHGLAFQTLS